MTTLYIFDAVNYNAHINMHSRVKLNAPVAQFEGKNEEECEQQAKDANYDLSNLFVWSYTDWSSFRL